MTDNVAKIHLLGKSYPIRCPVEQQGSLQQAAVFLDQKLQELRGANPQNSLEKIAITAALNLAHELLLAREGQGQSSQEVQQQLQGMTQSITDALTEQEEF